MTVNKLQVLSQDEQQREIYYAREKALLDEKSKVAFFRKKEEKAREQGIKEGKLQTAKKLLKMGINIEVIKEATNLSEEEIIKLKENI